MNNFRLKFIAEEVAKNHPELPKEMIEGLSFAIMLQLLMR